MLYYNVILFLFALYFVKLTWLQIVLVILSGLFSGLNNALFTTHVMESSPYERSITSGVYNFVRWLGAGVAPILSGVLGHKLFPQAPFGISGFIVLVGFLLMLLPVREPRRREEERRIHLHKKMGIY